MKLLRILTVILLSMYLSNMLSGCSTSKVKHYNSSVVQYLYPNKNQHIETPKIPLLSLPLRVGIAFVPGTSREPKNITERDKMVLMQEISKDFKKYDFVKSIDLIPSAYLTPKGSFRNLDQLRTMYGIDVIALISYDQTRFTDRGKASITYWTIIGAYIIPGEKNDIHTMVDASVYDIKSRKMLFRAPGLSHIKSRSTLMNVSEQIRIDSMKGFKQASEALAISLKEQLELFREKIKEAPEDYKIIHKPKPSHIGVGLGIGGGSLDLYFLIFIVVLGGFRFWTYRKG